MKKTVILFSIALIFIIKVQAQGPCPGQMLVNPNFTSNLTSWAQYGQTTTATVLNTSNGCLNQFLALQATNNSNVGISQAVTFQKDSCYNLCYCVEFPFVGALFNTKVTIAAVTSGITSTQLLTGSFTPAQAQIIDVIVGNNGFTPIVHCAPVFTATGNFTHFVILNETIGNLGTDVRIDNLCLFKDRCPPTCDSVNAGFTYTVGTNYTVQFTDISTSNPGDVLSYVWDFGDPPSGPNNTSTLQNPSHVYPGPGIYFVCLYLTSVMTNGLQCQDTFCIDVVVNPSAVNEIENPNILVYPNPITDHIIFSGLLGDETFYLYDNTGRLVMQSIIPKDGRLNLADLIESGFYYSLVKGKQYRNQFKLLLRH